jgi:hypothetical protein
MICGALGAAAGADTHTAVSPSSASRGSLLVHCKAVLSKWDAPRYLSVIVTITELVAELA